MGYKVGFSIYEGLTLGTMKVDVGEMLKSKDEMMKLGCGFLSYTFIRSQTPYDTKMCLRDFGVRMSEVNLGFTLDYFIF